MENLKIEFFFVMLITAEQEEDGKGDDVSVNSTGNQDMTPKVTRARGRLLEYTCSMLDSTVNLKYWAQSFIEWAVIFVYQCVRYSKRERGKLVQSYSSKDLEGILVSY